MRENALLRRVDLSELRARSGLRVFFLLGIGAMLVAEVVGVDARGRRIFQLDHDVHLTGFGKGHELADWLYVRDLYSIVG